MFDARAGEGLLQGERHECDVRPATRGNVYREAAATRRITKEKRLGFETATYIKYIYTNTILYI